MPYRFPQLAGKPFMPSNGTDGMIFCSEFCDNCIHQHPDADNERQCTDILLKSLIGEQPKEWIYDKLGQPTCTAFVNWNWGNGDDGWNEPDDPNGPIVPVDPDQLLIPFDMADLFGLTDIVVHPKGIFESALN